MSWPCAVSDDVELGSILCNDVLLTDWNKRWK